MKYKVIVPFIDKDTGKGYNEGSTFTSENSERTAFLAGNGFLYAADGEGTSKTEDTLNKPKVDEELLEKAKLLKVKGYTKMDEESLRKAIDAIESKKAGE